MADLPPDRLHLHKPTFNFKGVKCFGPYNIKISRRTEKRQGIIFKCMITRVVHLDLHPSIDSDLFLMAPHFGNCWEREIRLLKQALQVTIGTRSVAEEALQTMLVEIVGTLISKPMGLHLIRCGGL